MAGAQPVCLITPRRDAFQGQSSLRNVWCAAECLSHVAVGTPVTGCPPLRSVRAALPHTAPTSSVWRQSEYWDKDGPGTGAAATASANGRTAPSSSDPEGPAPSIVCVKFCKKESGMLRNVGKLFGRHRESDYVAGRRCRCEQLPGKVHAAWLLRLIVSLRCSFKVSMLR